MYIQKKVSHKTMITTLNKLQNNFPHPVMQLLILVTLMAVPNYANAANPQNRRCLNCHGQKEVTQLDLDERLSMIALPEDVDQNNLTGPDVRPELFVGPHSFELPGHSSASCVDCHADTQELPHLRSAQPASCTTNCHQKQAVAFRRGVHADALMQGDKNAPNCSTCHGGHDIKKNNNRDSMTYPLNVISTCASCHKDHTSQNGGQSGVERVQNYLDSVHGKAITKGGLVVAATCVDCHNSHDVLASSNPQSTTHRDIIPQTCGQCHIGVAETYKKSIHGQKLDKGDENAPVCTDCHTAHKISRSKTPEFMLDIVSECGACHDNSNMDNGRKTSFYKTYRRSYHGQITELGFERAARCSDCHGAHDILPITDQASRIHKDNVANTCRSCHPNATDKFASFMAHADYRDSKNYPLLNAIWWYFIIVMSGAFGFFGLHSIMWFLRSMIERIKHGSSPRHTAKKYGIKRFTRVNRINHVFVIITFFGLTLTGMPLFFSDQQWARTLALIFGGIEAGGIWHRIFGVMLLINFVVHLYSLYHRFTERREDILHWAMGPNSMVPRWKDVTDCLGMIKWFLVGGEKPKFDRWTYWEKFDYTAEIFGSMIIGGSGLLLWFPEFFSWLLPGWFFNIAMIVHGYEALLAVGFIFTIHFFNAHLRLEKFPVDDVIFTGQISEEEFIEERPVEYERLVEQGRLDEFRVKPSPPWARVASIIVGVVAMIIGTTMVVLMILAGLGLI